MKLCHCVFLALVFWMFSCSKSNSDSKTALLSASTWHIVSFDIAPGRNINGTIETDMYQFYDMCERDDYFTFSINGIASLSNGSLKCALNEPGIVQGTWFLSDSDTKFNLTLANNYFSDALDIIELTESTFKLAYYTKDSNGNITRVHTIRLQH